MRYPLVDGQGNFGSIDGDIARRRCATPRRGCKALGDDMMTDLDKETVDFTPNYDETTEEPTGSAGAVSRTCSSTDPPASPSAWRPTSRRTICARSSTRCVWLIENTHLARNADDAADAAPRSCKHSSGWCRDRTFRPPAIIVGRQGVVQAYTHRPRARS